MAKHRRQTASRPTKGTSSPGAGDALARQRKATDAERLRQRMSLLVITVGTAIALVLIGTVGSFLGPRSSPTPFVSASPAISISASPPR